ncbi:MAG: hypothetical protein ILP16_05785 [Spirochaetales bacterium]|nr:hypothetical protein [Spirochaetales bacterium]
MIRTRRILILVLLAMTACITPLFSLYQSDSVYSGAGEVIPVGSRLYELFDDLFLLCGQVSPSTSRPWTVSEARSELSKINETALSGYAKHLYDEISEIIAERKEHDFFVEFSLNPEIYVHSNTDFGLEENWNYGYTERNPFAYMGVNAYQKGFYFHFELTYGLSRAGSKDTLVSLRDYVENTLGKTYEGVGDAENEFGYSGAFEDIKVTARSEVYSPSFVFNGKGPADLETPRSAYLTYAWDGFSIGIYRGRKVWGRSRIGNFIYDEHVERYHFISAKTFNSRFSFDFTIMAPESYLGGNSDTRDYGPTRRFFLSHRLEYRFKDNMKLAISENVMYLATHFADFQYMNPASLYHNNLNSGQFNAIAHVEFEFAPCAGLQLYSQIAVDQGSVPFFEDNATEDLAAGLTVGAEYVFAAGEAIVDLNLEAVYASPALYRRDAPDFIMATGSRIDDDYLSIPSFTYMGFKYGGDTLGFRFDAEYKRGGLCVYANQTVLFCGGFTKYDRYTSGMFSDVFLSGDVVPVSLTDAGVRYSYDLMDSLNCTLFADACLICCDSSTDIQVSCGVRASYRKR